MRKEKTEKDGKVQMWKVVEGGCVGNGGKGWREKEGEEWGGGEERSVEKKSGDRCCIHLCIALFSLPLS